MDQQRQVTKQQTPQGEVTTENTSTTPAPGQVAEAEETKSIFQGRYIVMYILGVLEVLLAFRFVLKILGANPNSGFVSFIYSLSGFFTAPFSAIFRTATTEGVETTSVFEPATVIAMLVYLLVGWGLAKLIGALLVGKE